MLGMALGLKARGGMVSNVRAGEQTPGSRLGARNHPAWGANCSP
jgi:hypothetical protein